MFLDCRLGPTLPQQQSYLVKPRWRGGGQGGQVDEVEEGYGEEGYVVKGDVEVVEEGFVIDAEGEEGLY